MFERRFRFGPIALALLFTGCVADVAASHGPGPYYVSDFAQVPKFDAHVHINGSPEEFAKAAEASNFSVLTINVDYPDFPSLATQADIAHKAHAAHPKSVQYATTFSMAGWGQPGWASGVNTHIDEEIKQGAVGVKIWKNVGMAEKDKDGRLIMIDNPGFDPIVAHIMERHSVLIGHQGEPHNCWLPLEQMTTDNDREYFKAHPQYHMYLHPDQPSYEDQMQARDRFLARHPRLNFMGAHMASLEWSVDRLGQFLDANPSATIDLAARMTQVQYQSNRDYEKVRRFFIRYQDRILYGSDVSIGPNDNAAEAMAYIKKVWESDWAYLATGESQNIDALKADTRGLALPRQVIDKIYRKNAQRVFSLKS